MLMMPDRQEPWRYWLVPGVTEGEHFLLMRRRYGVSQESVAERVGTHQSRISAWERGEASLDATMELWSALFEIMGVSTLWELLGLSRAT